MSFGAQSFETERKDGRHGQAHRHGPQLNENARSVVHGAGRPFSGNLLGYFCTTIWSSHNPPRKPPERRSTLSVLATCFRITRSSGG
jgi:hypothetical protein